jgi:hypothetical protein
MLVLLAQLAHNLVVWAKRWLVELEPELARFGVQRLVRDLFAIAGAMVFASGRLVKVQLNQHNRLARRFHKPVAQYFARSKIEVVLGSQ